MNLKGKKLVLGSKLSKPEQEYALAAFVHRKLSPAFTTDGAWLANTRFAVTKTGQINRRVTYCVTNNSRGPKC